jgi:hypothetical protein
VALMLWRVVERGEYLVAERAVKTGRLEGHRVEPGRMAAAPQRARLGLGHQLPADSSPTQGGVDPEIVDEHPTRPDDGVETGEDLAISIADEKADPLGSAWQEGLIELIQSVVDVFAIGAMAPPRR